jgi:molybdenum cofactor cytidylyltransferase
MPGVTLVTGAETSDARLPGVSAEWLDRIKDFCTVNAIPLLIEADGARTRSLKAPGEHEPALPEWISCVVVTAGINTIGKPLTDEWVHRPERFSELAGQSIGEPISLQGMVNVLLHPRGGLKNIPEHARRVVLLNQADTELDQARAQQIAPDLLTAYEAVCISSLHPIAPFTENSFIAAQPCASGAPPVIAVHERVAGIILAAGDAQRFGSPKQLLDWQGVPFVRSVALTALRAELDPVILVTGAFAEQVSEALAGLPVKIVHNPDWEVGQGSSVAAGVRALNDSVGSAIFLLADQPQVTVNLLRALIDRHAVTLAAIVAPLIDRQRGNPVLFDRQTYHDLAALRGDPGGRILFDRYRVDWQPWNDATLLLDIDTPQDYQRLIESQGVIS